MQLRRFSRFAGLVVLTITLLWLPACVAPRGVLQSGRVTPKGHFRAGIDTSGNIATETTAELFDGLVDGVESLIQISQGSDDDKLGGDIGVETLQRYTRPLLMYSLDPVGWGFDFYVRYGVWERVDLGYKYSSGVHALDAMVQFLGPPGVGWPTARAAGRGHRPGGGRGPADGGEAGGLSTNPDARWYGSVGLQFSKQSFDIPFPGLEELQSLLGYEFGRMDLLVPLVFSYSFGPDEKYGALGFGLAYNYTKLEYGFDALSIGALFVDGALEENGVEVPAGKNSFHSVGVFFNLKAGYKYVYLVSSLAIYRQDYGTYQLFQEDPVSFSGWTIIPSLGVQGEFGAFHY